MIKNILIILFVLSAFIINAQQFEWALGMGSSGYETKGNSISVDDNGNVFTVGTFSDTVDFDNGMGVYNLISNGMQDMFISKLDSNGNFIWAKNIGGADNDRVSSIVLDAVGNMYITGFFRGLVDFDPNIGSTTLTTALVGGNYVSNIFICKLNNNGSFIWVKSMEGYGYSTGLSISIDNNMNVYTTGYFKSVVDFDPGSSVFYLSSISSKKNIFISKLDSNGDFIWVKHIESANDAMGGYIYIDDLGNIYTTGCYRGTADFDPGTSIYNLASIYSFNYQVFLTKMDSNGNLLWARNIAGSINQMSYHYDWGKTFAIDDSYNIYLTGYFWGDVDFNPGIGVDSLSSNGNSDIYICKLDSIGNYFWTKSMGSTYGDESRSICVDNAGGVYIIGKYSGVVDFDPDTSIYNLSSYSNQNSLFISKYDTNGNIIMANSIRVFGNGNGTILAHDMVLDYNKNIYMTGFFNSMSQVDFNPGSSQYIMSNLGVNDVFVSKFSSCGGAIHNTTSHTFLVCNSFTWIDGNTYTSSNNTATHTFKTKYGCDSIITLNLTILDTIFYGLDIQTAFCSYTWIDGITYTSSNNSATHTLSTSTLNAYGCDSIVTLDLTIIDTTFSSNDTYFQCDNLTWIDGNTYTSSNNTATHTLISSTGCDSVITLDLTIHNTLYSGVAIKNEWCTYTWIDGNTYTSSNNTATHTLLTSTGCDSIVTLDLTINNIDTSVTNVLGVFTSNQAAATYKWYICNNSFIPISGAISQSFTPPTNGSYAVVVSNGNNCSDTSSCILINNVAIAENAANISLYPNPTNNLIKLDIEGYNGYVNVEVYDLQGRLLETTTNTIISMGEYAKGIYVFKVAYGDRTQELKVVKE